ncbi:MAG: ABC transporter substrate-binding protein [Acetobacteraceae bacterium]
MSTTRRHFIGASTGVIGLAATGLARPALAASEPIRIGWMPALTGTSSSTGIALNRGTMLAVSEINAAGGINGRTIELVTRDTQSDPTKAVNAASELTHSQKVDVIWGPGNSGEALATMAIISRAQVPQIDPCFVDTVIDPVKYPFAFRNAPSNEQVGTAAATYVVDVLKLHKVALLGDTTGYGTSAIAEYAPILKKKGAELVYNGVIDGNQTDFTSDVMKMRDLGAEAIMPWSVNTGFLARLLNARGHLGWDVPVAGQPTLGSGQTRALLDKPEYWEKVFQLGFRSCSYGPDGRLPARTEEFLGRLRTAKIDVHDTLLWWIACGYDVPYLVAAAFKNGAGTAKEIAAYWNTLKAYPGIYGDYSYTAEDHNGYPDSGVVMSQANSFRDGAFKIAAGYV